MKVEISKQKSIFFNQRKTKYLVRKYFTYIGLPHEIINIILKYCRVYIN